MCVCVRERERERGTRRERKVSKEECCEVICLCMWCSSKPGIRNALTFRSHLKPILGHNTGHAFTIIWLNCMQNSITHQAHYRILHFRTLLTMDPIPARITYRSRLQSTDQATHCFYTLCKHASFVYSRPYPLPSFSCCLVENELCVFCTPPSKLMVLDQDLFFPYSLDHWQPVIILGRSVSVWMSLGIQ